ncbi:MAG: hypothetical protein ABID63_07010 [Pseudomonadota bacterium]
MLAPVLNQQNVGYTGQTARLMAAGARGISTVNRDTEIEASNPYFGHDPDTDGIVFNAYVGDEEEHGARQNNGGQDPSPDRGRSGLRRMSASTGDGMTIPGKDFANLLDASIPRDLNAPMSGSSFYALINAVTQGMMVRGQSLDFQI